MRSVAEILFPAGVRLSTWLMAAVFVALAIRRRDWMPIAAAWAWMVSWEAAFQIASLALGNLPVGADGPIFYIVVAVLSLPVLLRLGVRVDVRLLCEALLFFAVWVTTGFHVNGHTMTGFSVPDEILNETAKTLCGVAWLLPLLRSDVDAPEMDALAAARHTAPADLRS